MNDSVFSKIIRGEIPCYKIYEDDKTLAFLDIHPVQTGHVLVVPKVQVDQFQDLEDVDYAAVWQTVKQVSKQIKTVFGRSRVGIKVIGLDVPHAHIHVFPFDTIEQYLTPPNLLAEPDHSVLSGVHQKLTML